MGYLWDLPDINIIKKIAYHGNTSVSQLLKEKKSKLARSTVYSKVRIMLKHGVLRGDFKHISVTDKGKMLIANIKSENIVKSFSPSELRYRIVNKNGVDQVVQVFHGTPWPTVEK